MPCESFTVRRASPDGLSYRCRACAKVYSKQLYAIKPDAFKQRAKAWTAKNPERRKQIATKSAAKHAAKKNAQSKEYRRKRFAENPELVRLQGRMAASKRRVRDVAAGEMPPPELVTLILKMARGRCVYCFAEDIPTLDHIDPVSRAGGNHWENFIRVCKSCNSSKCNRDFADWLHRKHGVDGLVRAYFFMVSLRKAVRKLYPHLYAEFVQRCANSIEIREV